jgi:molybdenum cofactor biosynthesis enzyme MoaA
MNYYEVKPEDNHFKVIFVDLTHRCNMDCFNCYLPNRTIPDMNENMLYDVLSRLPERAYIRLIGAEPTLRKDLPEIISKVLEYGHKPSVTTNGLKLASLKYCQELRNAGLRMILLSMNGADEKHIYEKLDNHSHAHELKMQALENCFKTKGFIINTGTIIAKGLNEHTLKRQADIVADLADKYKPKVKPVLRVKNIGDLGRYMAGYTMDFQELVNIASQQLNISKSVIKAQRVESGTNKITANNYGESYLFEYRNVYIRLINWNEEDDLNDSGINGSKNRGRLTEDGMIAPCWEHIKLNEYGY